MTTQIAEEGIPIHLMPFRDYAAVGVMSIGTLLAITEDPNREENRKALASGGRALRDHAEIRGQVQRLLRGTAKGRNVPEYADYIAQGLSGKLGRAWSTPPVCLWCAEEETLEVRRQEGQPFATIYVPPGTPIVAIDGETQLAALFRIYEEPEAYDLDLRAFRRMSLPYELYWNISVADARQSFHDRNLLGVPVNKTLALGMDTRDLGTTIAQRVVSSTTVEVEGRPESLSTYVNVAKRQLSKADPEWLTLSAVRTLAVTTVWGKSGVEMTSSSLSADDLPAGASEEEVLAEAASLIALVFRTFADEFRGRTSITAPAVLAGIGVALHRATPWADENDGVRLARENVVALLSQVRWERQADYWDGVAAKVTPSGGLSFAGGAKDSGHRVADAILNPHSDLGRRIRGR